mgnify:CR=1 FL=1
MDKTFCPLIRKDCVKHKCAWYTHLVGKDPQTGQDIDNWGCAVGFIPLLQVELAGQTRGTTASVDKLREEHDNVARAQCNLMTAMVQMQQIEPAKTEILPN